MLMVITEDLWWQVPDWITTKYNVLEDPGLYMNPDRIAAVAKTAESLVIRNKTRVDQRLLEYLPNLKVIGRLGVGLDNIDISCCQERGIKVVAAKWCNGNAVAEYVIACMFQSARFLDKCDASTRKGEWDRLRCMGIEINGKVLGLVGIGDIGQRVAVRAKALGLKVLAYDPFVLKTSMLVQDFGIELVTLDRLCQESDYISVHVPLTLSTKYLIDEVQMSQMKETAVIINTSRGGIINESTLYKYLTNYPKRFAFLDVREKEPPNTNDSFHSLSNVVVTPHIAGITQESSQRVAEMILEDIDKVMSGEKVLTEVY